MIPNKNVSNPLEQFFTIDRILITNNLYPILRLIVSLDYHYHYLLTKRRLGMFKNRVCKTICGPICNSRTKTWRSI